MTSGRTLTATLLHVSEADTRLGSGGGTCAGHCTTMDGSLRYVAANDDTAQSWNARFRLLTNPASEEKSYPAGKPRPASARLAASRIWLTVMPLSESPAFV